MRLSQLWSGQVRVTGWAWIATLGACMMLTPLMDSVGFLFAGGVGAAVVGLVGIGMRSLRSPRLLTFLAQLAAVAQWALLSFAGEHMRFVVIPTPAAVEAMVRHLEQFDAMANRYAPPMPTDASATAVMAVLVALVAVIVDLVALGWRQVPILGLLFLGIYMAPVSLLSGEVSPAAFIPGAVGFILLLAAEHRERLVRWGRQVVDTHEVNPGRGVDAGLLIASGRQVGLAAVALAVVLPLLVPTFSPTYLGPGGTRSGSDGGGGGGDQLTVDNPVLDLRRNLDRPSNDALLTFTTTDPDPEVIRMTSLDVFTGSEWRPGDRPEDIGIPALSPLPTPPGLSTAIRRNPYTYDMNVIGPWSTSWLPVVYAPSAIVNLSGEWRLDPANFDVLTDESRSNFSYSFEVIDPDPEPEQMQAAGPVPRDVSRYTELPEDLPSVIGDIAAGLTEDEPTSFDKAVALQDWFRTNGGFEYSLEAAPGNGIDTITSFVTDDKVGYCEQFASAMALMARELGIPARVAVGFLGPTRNEDGSYTLRAHDMHAWPELYFSGVGWMRFEPTPTTRTGDAPDYTTEEGSSGPTDTPSVTAPSESVPTTAPREDRLDEGAAGRGGDDDSFPWQTAALVLLGVVLAVALLLAPRTLRSWITRRRWRNATTPASMAAAAWAELRDSVIDLSLPWNDRATPRGLRDQMRFRLGGSTEAEEALDALVRFVEQGRYARHPVTSDVVRPALRTVVRVLAQGRSTQVQRRSRWFPRSLVVRRRPLGDVASAGWRGRRQPAVPVGD